MSTVIPFPQCRAGNRYRAEHFETNRTSDIYYVPDDSGEQFACCADCRKYVNCHGEVLPEEEVPEEEVPEEARGSVSGMLTLVEEGWW